MLLIILIFSTAGYMKTVPSVYTLLINTIYLSLSIQVAEWTLFRKHTLSEKENFQLRHLKKIVHCINIIKFLLQAVIQMEEFDIIYLSIYLSIYLECWPWGRSYRRGSSMLSIYPSIYLSIFIPFYISIIISFYICIYPSIYLYIFLYIYLSIYLSILSI